VTEDNDETLLVPGIPAGTVIHTAPEWWSYAAYGGEDCGFDGPTCPVSGGVCECVNASLLVRELERGVRGVDVWLPVVCGKVRRS
jgi:hypothetical protein